MNPVAKKYDVRFNHSQLPKHVYSLLVCRCVFRYLHARRIQKNNEHQDPTNMHAVQKQCSVAATSPRIGPDEAKQAAWLKSPRDLHG